MKKQIDKVKEIYRVAHTVNIDGNDECLYIPNDEECLGYIDYLLEEEHIRLTEKKQWTENKQTKS